MDINKRKNSNDYGSDGSTRMDSFSDIDGVGSLRTSPKKKKKKKKDRDSSKESKSSKKKIKAPPSPKESE